MLTRQMQIQAIADRMAGMEVSEKGRLFSEPWRTCYEALRDVRRTDHPASAAKVLLEALREHEDRDEIIGQIMATEPGGVPEIMSLADIAEDLPPIEYEWDPWLPRGLLTVMGASQGVGKSFVALDLAYRIINVGKWPDDSPCPRAGWPVVYVDAESVPQIVNERADNYGLDKDRLFLMHAEPGDVIDLGRPEWQDRLIETVATAQPAMLIIDSLSAIHSKGQNNVEDVRALLGFLTQVTSYYQVATVLVHHIRKPSGGVQMQMFDLDLSDLSGSGYITQVARVVWGLHIVQTESEPDPNGPREMRMLKNNLGPCAEPLSFEFAPMHPRGVCLKWSMGAPKKYAPPTCEDWLREYLMSYGEPVKPAEAIEEGEANGFSRRSVYRARRRLASKVQDTEDNARNPNNRWEWVA
jgi:hypothetical protein